MKILDSKGFFRIAEEVTRKHRETKIGAELYKTMEIQLKMMNDLLEEYYDLVKWYESIEMDVDELKEMFEKEEE